MRILFTLLEQFRSLFSLILRRPSSQNYSFSAFSSFSLKSYRCFVQISSNQFGIFSFTCIYILSSIVIRSQILPDVFFIFSSIVFNSYGGSFKSSRHSFSYQLFVVFNPSGGSLKTFSSLLHIYLNPFYEN